MKYVVMLMANLTFQYPAWFLLLCALLGLGYALLLYYRDTTFREQSSRLNLWLGILRWLSVTLISALLLAPLLKRRVSEVKKPVVVMAQDASESIAQDLQGETLDKYKQDWQALKSRLEEEYEVHELAFGDEVTEGINFAFEQKTTNLSEVMQAAYDLYGTQNLGAVILASDGIYNEGSNPAYAGVQIAAPVYTVALGDTTPKRDLVLKRVFHNKIAYLGDKFSIQIDVGAVNCAGSKTVLTVHKVEGSQRRQLHSIPLDINSNDFFSTREVLIDADKPGVAQYQVSVARIGGETSQANNVRDIFIDILDARQRILILANAPHPDVTALRQMLDLNQNYQVEVAYPRDPGLDVTRFDFVVLHNLPSFQYDVSGLIQNMDNKRIPRLFVAGMQTNFPALSGLQGLVNVRSDGRQQDDVQGKVSARFSTFNISPETANELPKFNPVQSAFGTFSATSQADVVLWKRIGRVDTEQPLLAIGEVNGIRSGVFMGEGLWKWRFFDYLQHQNHDIFDEVFGKTVQYLSLKEDKRKFRVTVEQNIFKENEPVLFGAELYNDNYELTNDADVSLVVKNSSGKEYAYTFNKSGKAYTLNAGILPIGNYTYRATTSFNNNALTFDGKFSVQPVQLELFETTANHAVLRQLSTQFGGETIGPDQLARIPDLITAKGTVKPVIYESTQTNPLINLKWIFALLAGLLALEWFLRRYFGAY